MTITYADFLQVARDNDGEVLPTAGAQAMFRLEMSGQSMSFTPLSTGRARPLSEKTVQRYLDVYNKDPSANTTAYTDKMHHASYVLTIIKLWEGQRPDAPLINDGTGEADEIDPEFSAPEGDGKIRSHRYRERSREVVRMAKELFYQTHGRLFCEVCKFDFGKVYAEPGFIEAHHRIPLRDLQPGTKTKPSDLAMVCANCHRMLHRGSPWPTISQLQQKRAGARARLPTRA